MWASLKNIYRLGVKELYSLRSDVVMVVLILYTFSYAIYTPAQHAQTELRNASVAIVDHDHSRLSQRIRDALLPPYFQEPARIDERDIDAAMDAGRYTFVLYIPAELEADLLADRRPTLQLNVDATAMTQAGHGANYIQRIVDQEVGHFLRGQDSEKTSPVQLVIRARFNPNLQSRWFLAVMQLINMITLMAVILTGAALIREREHGTIEHLLVMPLRPVEIMLAKVWANGLVIVVAATLSLYLMIQGLLEVPVAGSVALFVSGTALYLFSVTALGIFLATLARTMPQFGLLAFPVFMVMNLLSGGTTPLESMPELLQYLMQLAPSTHFVAFAQGVLYRGAGLTILWPSLLAITVIGAVFFAAALRRFRITVDNGR
ncbi:MAG: ABC transporter permease [Gammaproteobacteria bacterium]